MNKEEAKKVLYEIFDLGWRVGRYEAVNQLYGLDRLWQDKAKEFQDRDAKIKLILEQIND